LEGGYHIHGELMLSSKSAQQILFKALKPLLEVARPIGGLLVGPLPRYLMRGCCADTDHMPGRTSEDFGDQLKGELKAAAANVRDMCFTGGMRFLRVLDPALDFKGKADTAVWGTDPIHPTEAGYDLLAAEAVRQAALEPRGTGKKRKRDEADEQQHGDGGRALREPSGSGSGGQDGRSGPGGG
jgi:hypothetical protein